MRTLFRSSPYNYTCCTDSPDDLRTWIGMKPGYLALYSYKYKAEKPVNYFCINLKPRRDAIRFRVFVPLYCALLELSLARPSCSSLTHLEFVWKSLIIGQRSKTVESGPWMLSMTEMFPCQGVTTEWTITWWKMYFLSIVSVYFFCRLRKYISLQSQLRNNS